MNSRKKYQSELIVLPAGTSTLEQFEFKLSGSYDRCTGIAAYVGGGNSNPTPSNFRVAIADENETLQDRLSIFDLIADQSVPFEKRYKAFDTPANGRKIVVQVEPRGVGGLTADLELEIVFQLEKA